MILCILWMKPILFIDIAPQANTNPSSLIFQLPIGFVQFFPISHHTMPNISFFIRFKFIKLRFICKNYFGPLFSYPIQVLFRENNFSSTIFFWNQFSLAIFSFNPNSFNQCRIILTLMFFQDLALFLYES